MADNQTDEWLLPQQELPGRPKLSERRLYRRRERTFLVLAGVFIVACALLPLLGAGKVFGVTGLVRQIGLSPSRQLLLPLGAIALPLGLLAVGLICEVYGRRRARALLLVGVVLWGGLLGLLWVTDAVPDYDGVRARAFWPGLAFASCGLVTCSLYMELFHAVKRVTHGRHLWLRNCLAALLALVAGWGCFVAIVSKVPGAELPPLAGFAAYDQLVSIATAAGTYSALAAIVATLPLYIIAKAIAVHTRIARITADDADDDRGYGETEPAFASRSPRPDRSGAGSRPFTRDEDAGDDPSKPLAADSFGDLDRPTRR